MHKKVLYLIAGILAGLIVAGGAAYGGARLATGGAWDNSVQDAAVAQQNKDTGRLINLQPAPTIKYSVERQNLIERYKTFADRNKISYIALVGQNGQVVYTGVVKGKISATSSELTPDDRMQCAGGDYQHDQGIGCSTVKVPEPDGSWATNGGGVFWFDDKDVYHEWNGVYLTADAPFTLTQSPLLTINGTATATATK